MARLQREFFIMSAEKYVKASKHVTPQLVEKCIMQQCERDTRNAIRRSDTETPRHLDTYLPCLAHFFILLRFFKSVYTTRILGSVGDVLLNTKYFFCSTLYLVHR